MPASVLASSFGSDIQLSALKDSVGARAVEGDAMCHRR